MSLAQFVSTAQRLALVLATTLGLGIGSAQAQTAGAAAEPSPAAMLAALTKASEAVYGVRARVAANARSAETLGRQRSGSGVVVGPDGLVLTIGYLVMEAEQVELLDSEGRATPAKVVAVDLASGFGLVQAIVPLAGEPVRVGSLSGATGAAAGQPALVVSGGPQGDVSAAQIVSRRAFSGNWEYFLDSALFTSPPRADHSGAALFNQQGELLGIGSLLVSQVIPGRNLPGNMFVPAELFASIRAELQSQGHSRASKRPWLGINAGESNGRVEVGRVNRDSPASEAGLKPGDIILGIEGQRVATLEALYKRLWQAEVGAEVRLTVLQGAEVKEIRVKTVDRMSTLARPAGV
jgi:S1-C subfamily serine protease